VSVGKLFAIIVALAVLFAPSVVAAEHMAITPGHDMQMMEMGHCDGMPSKPADHGKVNGKSCCISMCMAVTIAPSAPADAAQAKHDAAYFVVPQSWHGFLGEIATPPPRIA
jgi:hypothetical protein